MKAQLKRINHFPDQKKNNKILRNEVKRNKVEERHWTLPSTSDPGKIKHLWFSKDTLKKKKRILLFMITRTCFTQFSTKAFFFPLFGITSCHTSFRLSALESRFLKKSTGKEKKSVCSKNAKAIFQSNSLVLRSPISSTTWKSSLHSVIVPWKRERYLRINGIRIPARPSSDNPFVRRDMRKRSPLL